MCLIFVHKSCPVVAENNQLRTNKGIVYMLEFIYLKLVAIVCCSYIGTKLPIHGQAEQDAAAEKAAKIEEQKRLKQEKV